MMTFSVGRERGQLHVCTQLPCLQKAFLSSYPIASCAAVFSVTPPLSLHIRHLWGESGRATLKTAAWEASYPVDDTNFFSGKILYLGTGHYLCQRGGWQKKGGHSFFRSLEGGEVQRLLSEAYSSE